MVRIGQENDFDEISDCSIVTATYRINDVELGTIGCWGQPEWTTRKLYHLLNILERN